MTKREFIKCSEVEKEYGISKYFLQKAGVKGVRISDYKRAALYYSVKEIEQAISKWNGVLFKKQLPLSIDAPDWKSLAAGDNNNE